MLGGCGRAYQGAPNPIEIGAGEYGRVYQAAKLELRDHGFTLDRQDYRFGRLTTLPLASGTMIEPWKPGNATLYQKAQSTINAERRVVTVFLEPDRQMTRTDGSSTPVAGNVGNAWASTGATQPGAADSYRLRVIVMVERLDQPTRRMAGSIDAGRLNSFLSEVPIDYQRRGIDGTYWEPVTRDPYMEQELVAGIIRRSVKIGL